MNVEAILRGFYKRADEIAQAIKPTPYDDVLSKVDFGVTPKIITPNLMQKSDVYNDSMDGYTYGKGFANQRSMPPVTSKIAPSKMVAPFYGNKYEQEVNKAVEYNKTNQTVPYNLRDQLNTPVSIREWPTGVASSRTMPGLDVQMGTRYFPPTASSKSDMSVKTLLNSNEQNALYKDPKFLNTTVGHEVGHALYPPFSNGFWGPPDNTRDRVNSLGPPPRFGTESTKLEQDQLNEWLSKDLELRDERFLKDKAYRELKNKTKTTNPQIWEGELNPIARGATHDAASAEVINYLGEIQRNKFLTEGKRFESPEEFSTWMDNLTNASTEEPLKDTMAQQALRGVLGKITDENMANDHMFTPNQDKMNSTAKAIDPKIKDYPLELKRHLRMMNYLRTTNPKEYERIKGYSSKIIPGLVNNNNKTTPYIS